MSSSWTAESVAVGDHPVNLLIQRLAPSSRTNTLNQLQRVARLLGGQDAYSFPWHELTYSDMAMLRTHYLSTVAFRTASNYIGAVRCVLKECRRLGWMTQAQYDACEVPRIRGESIPAGRHINSQEVATLFDYLHSLRSFSARRDTAAWAILFGTGVRRFELAGLKVADYEVESIIVWRGKGNKTRRCFLPKWTTQLVEEWLEHRGRRPGALICRVSRWDDVYPEHLDLSTLWRSLTSRAKAAGLEKMTLHDARRTFAGTLLEAGHDLSKVQKAMGHYSPAMTARYDRRPELARQVMAESIPNPMSYGGIPNR